MKRLIPLLLCLLITGISTRSFAADACVSPNSWPLSDGIVDFYTKRSSASCSSATVKTLTGGWDPPYFEGTCSAQGRDHSSWKTTLTTGIDTYHVGLPGAPGAPGDLTTWNLPSSSGDDWYLTNAKLAENSIPTITLDVGDGSGDATVYLVDGYNFKSNTVYLNDTNLRVAFINSAFADIRHNTATSGVWFVDSMIDGNDSGKASFRGGEKNNTCRTHVMYSEISGGLDAAKAHNMTFYRNHIHATIKKDAGHADGIQINSTSDCTFIFENNNEFLFRMTNQPIFLQNSNPGGISNTWLINNLISGGDRATGICGKTELGNNNRLGDCNEVVVCGNRVLGENGKPSWASPSTDRTNSVVGLPTEGAELEGGFNINGPIYSNDNGFQSGAVFAETITDEDGDSHTYPTRSPGGVGDVPTWLAAKKTEINTRVSLIEGWVQTIRSAAGGNDLQASASCTGDGVGATTATCQASATGGTTPYEFFYDCTGGTSYTSNGSDGDDISCTGLSEGDNTISFKIEDDIPNEVLITANANIESESWSSFVATPENCIDPCAPALLTYSLNFTPSSLTFDLDGDSVFDENPADLCDGEGPSSGTCALPNLAAGTLVLKGLADGLAIQDSIVVTAVGVGPQIESFDMWGSYVDDGITFRIVVSGDIGNDEQFVLGQEYGVAALGLLGAEPPAGQCVDFEWTDADTIVLDNVQGTFPLCFYNCGNGQPTAWPLANQPVGSGTLTAKWYDGPKVDGECTGTGGNEFSRTIVFFEGGSFRGGSISGGSLSYREQVEMMMKSLNNAYYEE